MAKQMQHFDVAVSILAQCSFEANVFSNSSVLPADLNTLIIVFEKKVPLCFFKERHSSKRCQEALFPPLATRCNVEISTKSGWKCDLYWTGKA